MAAVKADDTVLITSCALECNIYATQHLKLLCYLSLSAIDGIAVLGSTHVA